MQKPIVALYQCKYEGYFGNFAA